MMNPQTAVIIQHESYIFSLAVSPDGTLLACGGTEEVPITVWNIAQGTLVARLAGLTRQVQALAFSADGALLAAANLWGGLCVWEVASGRLLETRPNGSDRKKRSLVYPAKEPQARLPVMLSDSISGTRSRALAPNGRFLAVLNATVQVKKHKTAVILAELDPQQWPVSQTGTRQLAWAADSATLALAGSGWVGCWLPLATPAEFFATPLPAAGQVAALAVLGQSRQVFYAIGADVAIWTAQSPLPSVLTPWQRFLNQVPRQQPDSEATLKKEWTWDVTQWGYEGVHTYEGQLLWYSHSHNPHAGGGAHGQSYADFLAAGPSVAVPEPILVEICQMVRLLVE